MKKVLYEMRDKILVLTVALLAVFSLISPCFADDLSVEASISSNKISIREAAVLNLTFTGSKQVSSDVINLPKIDGLDIRPGGGESTRISVINGQYSSERSFSFSVFPTRLGAVHIPAMTFTIDGKDYATKPIEVEVVDAPSAAASTVDPAPNQDQAAAIQQIKDRLSMIISVPKAAIYVGQKVPVSIKLLVNQLPVRNVQYPKLDKDGFSMDAFGQPPQYTQVIDGVKYDVVDFKTNIYPLRAGKLQIGPIALQASLLYKISNQQGGNGFFDEDIFNNFFGNMQERPVTVNAVPLTLDVLDVPQEGKPTDFSGAVGEAKFEASISPNMVKVGDPVTLKMRLSGDVNLKSINMPQVSDVNFKVYDPQIKDDAQGKSLEQVIIPRNEKVEEVPALHFTYFDTAAGAYKTITQGPFPLKVVATATGEEFKAVGFANLPQAHEPIAIAAPVDYVQKYLIAPIGVMIAFLKKPICWIILFVLGLISGAWIIWRQFRKRLKTDTVFLRRVNALKQAKAGIKQAGEYVKSHKAKEFYGMVDKTLHKYIADKGIDRAQINEPQARQLQGLLDACDLARFAGVTVDVNRLEGDYQQLQEIIAHLDKNFK